MERKIRRMVRGQRAVDGAGVRLVRVLGHEDTNDFDPFLMLDSFDSTDPKDYVAGFPMHPHRGIETITYLIHGRIDHEDSLMNRGSILSGQAQWMTAGSGILHQEMPAASPRMLGFQLWLNLPRAEKMAAPAYYDITEGMIPLVKKGEAEVRVIAGRFEGRQGAQPRHLAASLYDLALPAGAGLSLETNKEDTVFLFTILGDAVLGGLRVPEKTAVLYGEGDRLSVQAAEEGPARVIYFAAPPLREPVAWGGPIVMNTQEELRQAFRELRQGSFLRHQMGPRA